MIENPGVGVTSNYGDMQVVVFLPGELSQQGYSFRPSNRDDGLEAVPRRDLQVIRAMLQDALDDVDEEHDRRVHARAEVGWASQPYPSATLAPPAPPRPAGW